MDDAALAARRHRPGHDSAVDRPRRCRRPDRRSQARAEGERRRPRDERSPSLQRRPRSEAYAYTGGKAFDPALPAVVFLHGALHDHSVWALPRASSRTTASPCSRPTCPATAAAPARRSRHRVARRLAARPARRGRVRAARAGRPQHGLADRARGRRPRAGARRALVMVGTAYPMKVSSALLDGARADPERRSTTSTRSRTPASPPSRPTPARARGCTAPTAP